MSRLRVRKRKTKRRLTVKQRLAISKRVRKHLRRRQALLRAEVARKMWRDNQCDICFGLHPTSRHK